MELEELQLHIEMQLRHIMCVDMSVGDALPQAVEHVRQMMAHSNNKCYCTSGGH